jgi:hypothetical protein
LATFKRAPFPTSRTGYRERRISAAKTNCV